MLDIRHEHFDNIASLVNTLDAREYNEWARHRREQSSHWSGDSYDRARDFLLHGDTREIKNLVPRNLPQAQGIRPRDVNGVIGYAPVVPLAILNVPTCMTARKNAPHNSKVVHIIYDCDASCNVTKNEMRAQGRRVVNMIVSLERAGYSIALDLFCSFQQTNASKYAMTLTLKDAGRPLDIKRLTYPLVHVSMLRQICFDWYERLPRADYVCGYGCPLYHEQKDYQRQFVTQVTHDARAIYITFASDIEQVTREITQGAR